MKSCARHRVARVFPWPTPLYGTPGYLLSSVGWCLSKLVTCTRLQAFQRISEVYQLYWATTHAQVVDDPPTLSICWCSDFALLRIISTRVSACTAWSVRRQYLRVLTKTEPFLDHFWTICSRNLLYRLNSAGRIILEVRETTPRLREQPVSTPGLTQRYQRGRRLYPRKGVPAIRRLWRYSGLGVPTGRADAPGPGCWRAAKTR
jgi:hypothetical protein